MKVKYFYRKIITYKNKLSCLMSIAILLFLVFEIPDWIIVALIRYHLKFLITCFILSIF